MPNAASRLVTIRDENSGALLAHRATVADSFFARFIGLMGRSSLQEGEGLLIVPCSSVHMFFMRFPIDVLYIDRERRIVGMDIGLRPWRIGGFYRGARCVVELPAGAARKAGVEVGHRVAVEGYDL